MASGREGYVPIPERAVLCHRVRSLSRGVHISVITVVETWFLKEELADQALKIMQEMDDIVGPAGHDDPGWIAHGQFLQSEDDPTRVIMMYPWRSRSSHEQVAAAEEPGLRQFCADYCARPRRIEYFTELPVEVEHDHGPTDDGEPGH